MINTKLITITWIITTGLKQLSTLVNKIMKRWPEVKFMTDAELGILITDIKKS